MALSLYDRNNIVAIVAVNDDMLILFFVDLLPIYLSMFPRS